MGIDFSLAPSRWKNRLKTSRQKADGQWRVIMFGRMEACRTARDNLKKRYPEFEYKVEGEAGGVLYARLRREGGDNAA